MDARPDGHQIMGAQTHHKGDSGSLHQAADNQSEYSDEAADNQSEYSDEAADNKSEYGDKAADNHNDKPEYSDSDDDGGPPPRRQAADDSSLASRAVDFLFKFLPTTEPGSVVKTEEDLLRMKSEFLCGFDASFRERTPVDIQIRAISYFRELQRALPAHKAILAARSNILVGRFTLRLPYLWREAPEAPALETVDLADDPEVVKALLDFLYSGSLPREVTEKHIDGLFINARLRDIPYLWEFCARHVLLSLTKSTAIEAFQLALAAGHRGLLEAVLDYIVENMEEIAFSKNYKQFTRVYPELAVKITRAFVMYGSTKRVKT